MGEAILNPANGEVLTLIAEAPSEPVEAAIRAAHRAFPSGSRTTAQQRSRILLGIADAIEQHADLLAHLQAVVEGVRTYGYYNAGQDCTAACRIYAQTSIHERLVAELGDAVSNLRFARKTAADNEIALLISARQRDREARFVERALGQPPIERVTGAAVHSGPDFYYQPTLLAGCRQPARGVRPGGQRHPFRRTGYPG